MVKQTIPSLSSREALPLSFAQQRLWFLNQLDSSSYAYNVPRAWRLTGEINIEALRRALDAIVARQEALRTNFVLQDESPIPIQIIRQARVFEFPIVDLSYTTPYERESVLQRLLCAESQRPFDLSKDLLLRAKLFRLDGNAHVLLCIMHHIATDGWSLNVFFEELTKFYNSYSSDMPYLLPKLPIQYADYAVWQSASLQGDVLQRLLAYSKERLTGAPRLLHLPTDRPRLPVQSYAGAQRSALLPKALVGALNDLSLHQRATLFMTLLAAWQVLLHRYTREIDISIGVPIAGRKHLETEQLIGFFVNTLVLRTDLSENPTFVELLARVSRISLEAFQHADLPFEKMVEEIQPDRSLSYSPLFQVMFAFENLPQPTHEMSGLDVAPIAIDAGIARFDLTLFVMRSADSLEAMIEYNTDLFDGATVERMLGHYQTLLHSLVANPDHHIADLPILTDAEKYQLVVEWNATSREYPRNKCLHQLFEDQVERRPDAIALVYEDQQLTYGELNRRANQLGHYLKNLGVGPETLVGICVDRSLEMVIGLLGILKAGGAYLPLDPNYPTDRLAFMMEDAQITLLLTQQQFIQNGKFKLPGDDSTSSFFDPRIQLLCLDQDWQKADSETKKNIENHTGSENLAYVIYTSGSTGKPKGVQTTHNNILRLFQVTEEKFQFCSSDVWTMFHSYTFDLSVWEMWGALLYGGKLLVVPYDTSRSTDEFAGLIKEHKVTVLNQTPSAFRQLIPQMIGVVSPDEMTLRTVICGGEALEYQSLQPWFERYGDEKPQVINMYGITETTVHVTYRRVAKADLNAALGSDVGKAISDLRIYLLDSHKQLVPVGVTGEIFVGGDGVARGYLNRPELTAERFIYHCFDGEPAQRLYRTGDLARYLPDGNIEFLGRIDNQVKIRGYRIELGEIESVLAQHPAVRESVVLAGEDKPGDPLTVLRTGKQLVAYVVPKGSAPATSELRTYLKAKLPEYMVPSAFVILESFPLTPNGKVDRKALPAPDRDRADLEQVYVAPRNSVEKSIAEIWAEILGIKRVCIHDNFFDLGGHSLKATQVGSRLRNVFQCEIPLRHLFEFPTIAELAVTIEAKTKAGFNNDKLGGLLTEIEALSEEDAQRLIANKGFANRQT